MAPGPWLGTRGSNGGPVVAFGEALVRLSSGHRRLVDAATLSIDVGGSELNVLTALGQLGHRGRWVTALAPDELGRRIREHARRYGVETATAAEAAGRTPLYFAEVGAPPRPTAVHYDRAGSALAQARAEDFAWDVLLHEARWFHSTGITLALGPGPRAAAASGFDRARRMSLPTSFDLNHRHRLWSWEEALPHYREVLLLTDVLFASPHDLRALTGSSAVGRDLMERATAQYGLRVVVMRTGEPAPAGGTMVRTLVLADGEYAESEPYTTVPVDPFGGGDAATAAFLAAALQGEDVPVAADRASWACAEKQSMPGDTWLTQPFTGAPTSAARAVLR